MSVIKKKVMKAVGKIVNYVTTATSQGTSDGALGKNFVPDEKIIGLCRKTGAEGIVMLKNDGALPLNGKKVAVFGRTQVDTIKCGTGSAFVGPNESVDN